MNVLLRNKRLQASSIDRDKTYVGAVSAAAHSDNAVIARRTNMIQEELRLMLCKKSKE